MGDTGCFGDADRELLLEEEFCLIEGIFARYCSFLEISISTFSSNAGPDMQESMLSPNICCRQLFPGALIDRSCSGGRPGIVARKGYQFKFRYTFGSRYTHENPWKLLELWSLAQALVH